MRYKVTFYNDLLDSRGMEHKVLQREVDVDYSGQEDVAIQMAKKEFCRLEDVSDSGNHAHYYEVVVIQDGQS